MQHSCDWSSFAEFMESVDSAVSELHLRPHQHAYFRGHENTMFTLTPSYFRGLTHNSADYPSNEVLQQLWKGERRVFHQFKSLARELYANENSDWDILFHMQHHGVPTRLLDWTSALGVALYFAIRNHKEGNSPCVWILNPYALNGAEWGYYRLFSPRYLAREEQSDRSYEYGEILLGDHPQKWEGRNLGWDAPKAIYSPQRSERMYAQSGWFTIHGLDTRPLEVIVAERASDAVTGERWQNVLRKVELPFSALGAAKKFLHAAGLSHRQLFPDLDGLARSVCEQFDLAKRS